MIRVRLVILGRVQGVGFRYAAREAALEHGVAGWTRNLPDGTVEIVAQGPVDAVARLKAWAERGPRYAGVERVEAEKLSVVDDTKGFEIRN